MKPLLMSAVLAGLAAGCGAQVGGDDGVPEEDPPHATGPDAGGGGGGGGGGVERRPDASTGHQIIGTDVDFVCEPGLIIKIVESPESLQPGTCIPWGDVHRFEVVLIGDYENTIVAPQTITWDSDVSGPGGGWSYDCPPSADLPDCTSNPRGEVHFDTYSAGQGASGTYQFENGDKLQFNATWCHQAVTCG